ncbi:hypothetical protein ACKC9G_06695 [Pokkaliibacter sp. CJK22405]|uniref:hypothetical protein n=1 Tax=Pokkaliibacter sp. CJK22405 TaxID=3384615 RepID=UPI0039854794
MYKHVALLGVITLLAGCNLKSDMLSGFPGQSSSTSTAVAGTSGTTAAPEDHWTPSSPIKPVLNDPATLSLTQQGWLPLAVGNRWTYSVTNPARVATAQVDAIQVIEGTPWYRYTFDGHIHWLTQDDDRLLEAVDYYDQSAITEVNPRTQEFLRPVASDRQRYVTEGGFMQAERCSQPVKVGAGSFDCVSYSLQVTPQEVRDDDYARNVGLIRRQLMTASGGVTTFSLDAFTPAKR